MSNQNRRSGDNSKNIDPVVAAVTGVVVGAGLAIAGVAALKDEKNIKNIKEMMTHVKNQAIGYVEDVKKSVKNEKVDLKKQINRGKEKTVKISKVTKGTLDQIKENVKKGGENI